MAERDRSGIAAQDTPSEERIEHSVLSQRANRERWRTSGVCIGISDKLADAEDALRGIESIAQILRTNQVEDMLARDGFYEHRPLSGYDVEGLQLGLIALASFAGGMLGSVRELHGRGIR